MPSIGAPLQLDPNLADAHLNLAQGLLRSGNFAEGWAEYEWRWQRKGMAEAVLDQPRWTGSPLAGRAILLRSEQGFGDLLQFVRYADLLHRQGGTVIVESPPVLASLMRSCPGVDRVVVHGEPLGEFDVHVPLLSVPGILGTSPETIPAKVPYLWPMQESIERWHEELAAESRLKIGIAWQGNPANLMDAFRSIPLAQFAAIARMRGVQLYSLQSGAGREQLAEVIDDWPIVDFGDGLGDFQTPAAVMRNLDLVISCDSAPAHLAGALGVPVWLAITVVPDWRWMLNRQDSPWYPTMRLFRQTRLGDWGGVFQDIQHALTSSLLIDCSRPV